MRDEHANRIKVTVVPYDRGDVAGLVIGGELDVAAIPWLEQRLDSAIRESHGVFVVETSHVTFMDSSGLGLLLRARALLAREERQLGVIAPSGPVKHMIDVAGVADLLLPYGSADDLHRDVVRPRG